jgi:hypothetical protein
VRKQDLEAMTTAELRELIEEAEDLIADRDQEPEDTPHHEVVKRRRARGGRWLQRELVKCGKPHCSKDRDGDTSKYVGKHLTLELAEEFGVPA